LLLKVKCVGGVNTLPDVIDNTISNNKFQFICDECDNVNNYSS